MEGLAGPGIGDLPGAMRRHSLRIGAPAKAPPPINTGKSSQ